MVSQDDILRAMMHGDEMSLPEIARRLSQRSTAAISAQVRWNQKKGRVQAKGRSDEAGKLRLYQITEIGLSYIRSGVKP